MPPECASGARPRRARTHQGDSAVPDRGWHQSPNRGIWLGHTNTHVTEAYVHVARMVQARQVAPVLAASLSVRTAAMGLEAGAHGGEGHGRLFPNCLSPLTVPALKAMMESISYTAWAAATAVISA